MDRELKDEELEQVAGGGIGHVDPDDIHSYAGRDMIFSYGWFGSSGGFPVHINSVNGTWVNMTFTGRTEEWMTTGKGWLAKWTFLGNATWEWDYDDGDCNWLE